MMEGLALHGWSSSDKVFPRDFCQLLAQECQDISNQGLLTKAAVGRGSEKAIHQEIRGDFIYWLDEDSARNLQKNFLALLKEIQENLNRNFFLGLKRVESHFALYPPGAGYQKHVDNPRGAGDRRITFILYLNSSWEAGQGGELSLFHPEKPSEILTRIAPVLGKFVLFRSEIFPHQVEKSFAPRKSLTGWFRNDALS